MGHRGAVTHAPDGGTSDEPGAAIEWLTQATHPRPPLPGTLNRHRLDALRRAVGDAVQIQATANRFPGYENPDAYPSSLHNLRNNVRPQAEWALQQTPQWSLPPSSQHWTATVGNSTTPSTTSQTRISCCLES